MAIVKQHLKWAFIGLNMIFTILGIVAFVEAIKTDVVIQTAFQERYSHFAWMQAPIWPLVFGLFAVAGLGFHGALTGQKWSLISFITANLIGLVTVLTLGAMVARMKAVGLFDVPVHREDVPEDVKFKEVVNRTIGISFAFAVLEATGIALAAMLMRQAA